VNNQKTIALNFNWCVDNDFMVYVVPDRFDPSGRASRCFRVAVRRGGITTCGLEFKKIMGTIRTSKEVVGSVLYKTQLEAEESLPELRRKLRERYG